MKRDKINFFVPLQFCKSHQQDENGNEIMEMEGIASTSDEDSDQEQLNPSGYDLTPFLTNGLINWNHKSKEDPSSVIGEPIIATITRNNEMYVKLRLYPDSEKAKQVYALGKVLESNSSSRKLGLSIEGFPIERDPINPKKILKAKITGLAITPTPKNRNTFASILKGEYAEPFLEDDEDDDEEIEKMVTTSTVAPITEESMDGVKVQEKIKKSEIYGLIEKSLNTTSPEVLIKTYNFLKKNNMNTKEEISKALDSLEQLLKGETPKELDSNKGEESTTVENEKSEEVVEGKTTEDDKDKEVPETIEDDKEEEEEDIEKAEKVSELARSIYNGQMSISNLAEALIKKDCPLELAVSTANSIVKEWNSKRQGGDIESTNQAVSSSISKSEIQELFEEGTSQLEKSLSDKLGSIVGVIRDVFKQSSEEITELKEELNSQKSELSIQKSENEQLTKRLKEPNQRRSVTSFRERFPEEEIEKGNKGNVSLLDSYDLSTRFGREGLCDAILLKKEESIQKGTPFDDEILKAIPSIEGNYKITDQKLLLKLKALFA